ncbi:thiamine pyrophosphokinase [Bacteroidia bacterium]|nr:thiamine pyrophosphokinase [Bacteroidia bacterium]
MKNTFRNIILANGEFPKNANLLQMLKNAETIVCCDGATEKLILFGIEPTYIIGDIDSLSDSLKKQYHQKIIHITEQDTNDLTKAVNFCKTNNIDNVAILGATGLRIDHTLGNISLLAEYSNILQNITLFTDDGFFTSIKNTTVFNSYQGQIVSIFSLTPSTKITYSGLEYPIKDRSLTSWWQGTLNKSLSDKFSIIFENGNVLVYQQY